MSYIINHYEGQQLVQVSDATIDDSTCDIKLIGRNYAGYGEAQNENFVFLLENFAGRNQPNRPLTGQIWYDTTTNKLKFYDGNMFMPTARMEVCNIPPTYSPKILGDLWFDTEDNQLFAWSGSTWTLVGPESPITTGTTKMRVSIVKDTVNVDHVIIEAVVNDDVVFVISSDEFVLSSSTPISGFSTIYEGTTLINTPNTGITTSSHRYWGTASNSLKLNGKTDDDFHPIGGNTGTSLSASYLMLPSTATSSNDVGGTIRYTSSGFQGRHGGSWVNFGGMSVPISVENGGTGLRTVGAAGTVLTSNGTGMYWGSGGGGTGGGGVSSVDVSGGGTGLTFTGGPITTGGTITLSGVLGVANGGTGQDGVGANNTVLASDGNQTYWRTLTDGGGDFINPYENFLRETTFRSQPSFEIGYNVAVDAEDKASLILNNNGLFIKNLTYSDESLTDGGFYYSAPLVINWHVDAPNSTERVKKGPPIFANFNLEKENGYPTFCLGWNIADPASTKAVKPHLKFTYDTTGMQVYLPNLRVDTVIEPDVPIFIKSNGQLFQPSTTSIAAQKLGVLENKGLQKYTDRFDSNGQFIKEAYLNIVSKSLGKPGLRLTNTTPGTAGSGVLEFTRYRDDGSNLATNNTIGNIMYFGRVKESLGTAGDFCGLETKVVAVNPQTSSPYKMQMKYAIRSADTAYNLVDRFVIDENGGINIPSLQPSSGTATIHIGGAGKLYIVADSSDIRLKENIQQLDKGLNEVLRLNPISFTWKPEINQDDKVHIGFIAQEVEKIIPEVIRYDPDANMDDDPIMNLDYMPMVSLLTKAIQEQQAMIDELKSSLIAIKSEYNSTIANLRQEIELLKS